jgi:NAD(P)H-dependent FMN reductase
MDTTAGETRSLRIAIVTGARPGRLDETVARWVLGVARRHCDARFSLVDVGGHRSPLTTAAPPRLGRQRPEHLHAWSRTVAALDGFVFVTAEYNEASSAVLKDAIHLVARDWHTTRPPGSSATEPGAPCVRSRICASRSTRSAWRRSVHRSP